MSIEVFNSVITHILQHTPQLVCRLQKCKVVLISVCHLPCDPQCLWNPLTVKLLLTFFVLDSATLASDRSTSSKIRDCGDEDERIWGGRRVPERKGGREEKKRMSLLTSFLIIYLFFKRTGLNLAYCNLHHERSGDKLQEPCFIMATKQMLNETSQYKMEDTAGVMIVTSDIWSFLWWCLCFCSVFTVEAFGIMNTAIDL